MPSAQPPQPASQHDGHLPDFVGVVLCGGASRRMGQDKATVSFRGRPLALVAVDALRDAGAVAVLAIGGDVAPLAAHGVELVPDRYPGEGPLGGIVTALDAAAALEADAVPVVVLTCDLPSIGADDVRAILRALIEEPGALAAVPLDDGRPQFLTAAYRADARSALAAAFDAGERAVRRALVDMPRVDVNGLDPRHLRDADTPEALDAAAGRDRAAG